MIRRLVFMPAIVFLCLSMNFVLPADTIQLDGIIGDNEWKGAIEYNLAGGGKMMLKKSKNELYVAMVSGKKGWAHVYLYYNDTVRIFHASAALGEARYVKQKGVWHPVQSFSWALREKDYNSELVKKQEDHYSKNGWVANNNNMGNGMVFEYKLKNSDINSTLSFACAMIETPMEIHYFPITLSDNTILEKLVQGYTPDSLEFNIGSWEKIR